MWNTKSIRGRIAPTSDTVKCITSFYMVTNPEFPMIPKMLWDTLLPLEGKTKPLWWLLKYHLDLRGISRMIFPMVVSYMRISSIFVLNITAEIFDINSFLKVKDYACFLLLITSEILRRIVFYFIRISTYYISAIRIAMVTSDLFILLILL